MKFIDGHTEAQMLPMVEYKEKKLVFMADLIPSLGHFPIPYVMGYDVRPLLTLNEKESLLNDAVGNDYILMFQHDAVNECCSVQMTDRGVRADQTLRLEEL